MKKIKQLFTPLAILALSTTFSFATIYSNGEDGTTGEWRVHDNKPSGATISNVIDEAKNSKVIEFKGSKRLNAYIIGAKKGNKAWNNSKETKLRWSMKFNEKYKIVVYVETSKGQRTFFYDYKNRDKGLYKTKYISIGLGNKTSQGDWVNIERDLKADLKQYEPDNTLLKVNGFKVQGSGRIDNLELYKADASTNLEISNISVKKKSDTYVKIYWDLNHKGTGQIEYGMTTDYGTFTKKENSLKYDSHRQSLRGLEPNTTYHYRVISEDEAGHRVVSEDKTFSTRIKNNLFNFKQRSDKATLKNGQKIQVLFNHYAQEKDISKYKLTIKDISTIKPSIIFEYIDTQSTSTNIVKIKDLEGKIFLNKNGTILYLFTTWRDYDSDGSLENKLIIYDISDLKHPYTLSSIDMIQYHAIHFLNENEILFSENAQNNAGIDPCDGNGQPYTQILNIRNPLKPVFSNHYLISIKDEQNYKDCVNYARITGEESNYLDYKQPDIRISLHGKPYSVLDNLVAIGKNGIEVINYENNDLNKVIATNISVKNIVKVSNSEYLIYNDTTYQYINIP